MGANPASSPLLGGAENRPLARVEDTARDLIRSLDPELAREAVIRARAVGTPYGPGGVPVSTFDSGQLAQTRAVLATYFGRVPDAASPLAGYDDDALRRLHFGWAGSTEPGRPHYYRLHGPNLSIEWDNTQDGGNHAHSVWQSPSTDFGADVLRTRADRPS